MSKTCFKCDIEQELSEFYKHRETADGHLGKCKDCTKLDVARNRLEKIDHYSAYDRMRYERDGHRYTVEGNEYNRKWRKVTGKGRIYDARRRASKLHAQGSYTAEEFHALCILYNWACLACGGSSVAMTADHVVPLSKGGTDYISNIQPLCQSCNSRKSDKEIDYR